MCLFLYSREIRLLSTLRCFRRYIADFILSIQIFPALKNNDQVFMTGLNLARIWNMELQGIAKCAFHLNHDFIPSSFQAAAVFKKHRFFLVYFLHEVMITIRSSVTKTIECQLPVLERISTGFFFCRPWSKWRQKGAKRRSLLVGWSPHGWLVWFLYLLQYLGL